MKGIKRVSKRPADGERSAASGYRAQYMIGASLILNVLEKGDLEWIRIADPEIGRIDDLQVGTTARVDGYQVKWEQYPGAITLHDITKEYGATPAIFTQLADGWTRLKEIYPANRVVVHLVTNQYASKSTTASLPNNPSPPSSYHFAGFIEQAWKPAQRKGEVVFEGQWEPVWREIQTVTELSVEDFKEFVLDCRLNFQTQKPDEREDITSIVDLLFATAASPERVVSLTRNEMINRLGWERKFSTWNIHEFPEPQYTYQPIRDTVNKLLTSLEELPGGYIGVFGSPGSGKSTLLTQTLRKMPVRLIRYYAYVPDAQDPSAIRGESISYLNDVTLKLIQAGITGGGTRDSTNRANLLHYLSEQFSILGEKFQENGEKTILLVDGLDHIDREQHPERSLLNDLPIPSEIPNGVYIVLGSQTDELPDLRQPIRDELSKEHRRIEMGKFSPGDTRAIASVAIPDLNDEENKIIYELSAGHPLAVIYLLRKIQQLADSEDRLSILKKAEPFTGDIDEQYWSHWHKFEDDTELTRVLGLLSRTRGPISMEWVAKWARSDLLIKLQKLFLTYFEKDGLDRWIFFHNSFRLFLISRTSEPLPGQTREQLDQSFHLELADRYQDAEAPWCWEALYHYYSAEDHEAVVNLATWDWFLQQTNELRPLDAIETDIRLALKSAGKCKNSISLVRLTLIGAAIQQRIGVLEEYSLSDLLIRCGKPDIAADHVRDGNRIRIKPEQALNISAELFDAGLKRESRHIFELSEPHELLSGSLIENPIPQTENVWDVLKSWVRSAILFYGPDEIIEAVRRIQISSKRMNAGDIESESRRLQRWLIFQAALAYCKRGKWDKWEELLNALDDDKDQVLRMFTLLRSAEIVQEIGDIDRVKELLSIILETYPPSFFESTGNVEWRIDGKISIAKLLIKFEELKSLAINYIEDLDPIPLYDSDLGYGEDAIQQEQRFRFACIQYLLGNSVEPRQMLREAETKTTFLQHTDEEEKEVFRQIAFATYSLAKLWAWGKSGSYLSPDVFLQEVKWIFDLFGRGWTDLSRRAHFISGDIRFNTFSCLILAAQQHGREVLNAVKNNFESRWLDSEEGEEWWVGLQRKLIYLFVEVGIDSYWATGQLGRISQRIYKGLDSYGRVDECQGLADTWLLIDDSEEAYKAIKNMVNAARGVRSEKDYQLLEWVKWLGYVNKVEPERAPERIRLMLQRIVSVRGVASGVDTAAQELLGVVFQWSPHRSVKLWKALLEANLIHFKDGLISILNTALDSPNPPYEYVKQIVLNLIIPFLPSPEPEIIEGLIVVEAKLEGKEGAQEVGQIYIDRIGVDALSKDRYGWSQGVVKGLQKAGVSKDQINITPDIQEISDEQNNSQLDRRLHLKNGQVLSLEELLLTVNNIDDLKGLLEKEDRSKATYFDWGDIVENLVPQIVDEAGLLEVEALISERLSNVTSKEIYLGRLHIALSQCYAELGSPDLAWEHAEKALDFSGSYSWDPRWDGGNRLKALQQLRKVDSVRRDKFVFDLYATDLSDRSYYPESLITSLYEIFEVLSIDLPISYIWTEIEHYLTDLFVCEEVEEAVGFENAIEDSEASSENDSPRMAIIEILVLCLTYPAYPIAQGAVAGLAQIFISDNVLISEVISSYLLSSNDLLVERLLMVLDTVSLINNDMAGLREIKNDIGNLFLSPNFAIRLMASKVISRIKKTPLRICGDRAELPSIYKLQLPDSSIYDTWQAKKDKESTFLLGDLARKLSPFDREFREIAHLAGLPIDNVLYRAAQLFDTFLVERIWIDGNEPVSDKRLAAFLENTGVIVSHTKPHIFAARQALAYIIAELWDCELLDLSDIGTLQLLLQNFDPEFIIREPSERPDFIDSIGDQKDKGYFDLFSNNWIEKAEESIPLISERTDNDLIILGESTEIKFLQDDWPTEIRYSVVKGKRREKFWNESDIDRGLSPFHREVGKLKYQYPSIQAPKGEFIVSNLAIGFETAGTSWLALNPSVAYELGWILDSEGLFQWIDDRGNVVARSLWWRDGNLELHSRFERDEVVEGWLVLMSIQGFAEIKNRLPILNRGCVVHRRLGWGGMKESNISKQIKPFD